MVLERADDGRFDADRRIPTVEDQRNAVSEIFGDAGRTGRTDASRRIGAGRRDRPVERVRELCENAARGAKRDRVEPRTGERVDRARRNERTDDRQRPGPEGLCEMAGERREIGQPLCHGDTRHMADERVEARPAFGGEDPGDGLAMGGIGGEPINGFRRDRDRLALPKISEGLGKAFRRLGGDHTHSRLASA